ncbi:hypothetical protein O6H91_02G028900 [Diphasiastrum complanatum]|uniref:Uncharacterized protein n=1 Tax=Diphasiastrum complanatum TaxID=34168 RepID=A0ACC2EDW6_DIPCM|nr:hypothetical protein O6H91_02G028900 [Diphasiastrum complanatum]
MDGSLDSFTTLSQGTNLESKLEAKSKERNSQEITPGIFYGSPAGKPSKKPVQLLHLLNEIQFDLAKEKEVESREPIWVTFPRQDQAIQYADSHGKAIAVFTYQDHRSGQRRFLATSYEEFWCRYKNMQADVRHHYEIIRQRIPCHLYFDIEFNRDVNKDADGEEMVDILLSAVSSAFWDVYSLTYEPCWTVELDSSTGEKFSRHLVIRIPKAAFRDNSHVGAFVGEICARISRLRDSDDKFNHLFVLEGDSRAMQQSKIFVDQAVYSRNRSFRLPFSSKAGKSSMLLPTHRFRCKGKEEKIVFMEALICKLDDECKDLLTFGTEAANRGGSLPMGAFQVGPSAKTIHFGAFNISGTSPFPALDKFVESIACIEDIPGKIRSWYWFAEYGVVVYNISGNRFCEHIGRQHKSNNVMYIVDFRTAGYYQKCHDPDCRGFRSPLRPIPRHIIPPNFPLSTASPREDSVGDKGMHNVESRNLNLARNEEVISAFQIHDLSNDGGNALCTQSVTSYSSQACQEACFLDPAEDEAWWGEVISSVAKVEATCNKLRASAEGSLHQEAAIDANHTNMLADNLKFEFLKC